MGSCYIEFEMTNRTATDHAATLYAVAYALNNDPAQSGAPCRATFRAARAVLCEAYGPVLAGIIDQNVMDCGEYEAGDIARHRDEAVVDCVVGFLFDCIEEIAAEKEDLAAARATADANFRAFRAGADRF